MGEKDSNTLLFLDYEFKTDRNNTQPTISTEEAALQCLRIIQDIEAEHSFLGVRKAVINYVGDNIRDLRENQAEINVTGNIVAPHLRYLINIQKTEAFVEHCDDFKDKAEMLKILAKGFNDEVVFEINYLPVDELHSCCKNTEFAKLLLSHITDDDLKCNPAFAHMIEQIDQCNPVAIVACQNSAVVKFAADLHAPKGNDTVEKANEIKRRKKTEHQIERD